MRSNVCLQDAWMDSRVLGDESTAKRNGGGDAGAGQSVAFSTRSSARRARYTAPPLSACKRAVRGAAHGSRDCRCAIRWTRSNVHPPESPPPRRAWRLLRLYTVLGVNAWRGVHLGHFPSMVAPNPSLLPTPRLRQLLLALHSVALKSSFVLELRNPFYTLHIIYASPVDISH